MFCDAARSMGAYGRSQGRDYERVRLLCNQILDVSDLLVGIAARIGIQDLLNVVAEGCASGALERLVVAERP